MAAVIIPRDQLRIPEHLRGRLERPALRVVEPAGDRPTRVVALGDQGRQVPSVRPASQPLTPSRRRGGAARLVVLACVAVVALTGLTALVVGRPAPSPVPAAAAATPAVGPSSAAVVPGGTWVVQPGDSLWSIAAAVAPGADLRPIVDELARRAGGGDLQPGQRISVEGLAP